MTRRLRAVDRAFELLSYSCTIVEAPYSPPDSAQINKWAVLLGRLHAWNAPVAFAAMKHITIVLQKQERLLQRGSARNAKVLVRLCNTAYGLLAKAYATKRGPMRFVLAQLNGYVGRVADLLTELQFLLLRSEHFCFEHGRCISIAEYNLRQRDRLRAQFFANEVDRVTFPSGQCEPAQLDAVKDSFQFRNSFHEGSSVDDSNGVRANESMAGDVPHPPSVKQSHKQDRPC